MVSHRAFGLAAFKLFQHLLVRLELTFPNPLFELGGLAEQAMNNAVLLITAVNSKGCVSG